MTVTALNANIIAVSPLLDSEIPWAVETRTTRHYSAKRVSKSRNLFEVKLIAEDISAPLPPGEGASGDSDEFVDVWNDTF